MRKHIIFASIILLMGLVQAGCSSSQQPAHDHSHHEHGDHATKPDNAQTKKAIQDELKGLATIESDVKKGDFKNAGTLFEQIHGEYHSAVLPPVEAKNKALAEEMHGKFDALEDALNSKDKNK